MAQIPPPFTTRHRVIPNTLELAGRTAVRDEECAGPAQHDAMLFVLCVSSTRFALVALFLPTMFNHLIRITINTSTIALDAAYRLSQLPFYRVEPYERLV